MMPHLCWKSAQSHDRSDIVLRQFRWEPLILLRKTIRPTMRSEGSKQVSRDNHGLMLKQNAVIELQNYLLSSINKVFFPGRMPNRPSEKPYVIWQKQVLFRKTSLNTHGTTIITFFAAQFLLLHFPVVHVHNLIKTPHHWRKPEPKVSELLHSFFCCPGFSSSNTRQPAQVRLPRLPR